MSRFEPWIHPRRWVALVFAENSEGTQTGSIFQLLRIPSVIVVCAAVTIGTLAWAILDPTLQPHLAQVCVCVCVCVCVSVCVNVCMCVCEREVQVYGVCARAHVCV